MHTENSYKWTVPGFSALLKDAGYDEVQVWTDPAAQFAVMLAR